MTFNHLTLNTGAINEVTTSKLHKGRLKKAASMLPQGGLLPEPWNEMRVDFGYQEGFVSFCIHRADIPMIMNIVCWTEELSQQAFHEAENFYNNQYESNPDIMKMIGSATHIEPPTSPWLATIILPSIFQAYSPQKLQEHISNIANFEQIMAATIINKKSKHI